MVTPEGLEGNSIYGFLLSTQSLGYPNLGFSVGLGAIARGLQLERTARV
jgi:hypothetical protein